MRSIWHHGIVLLCSSLFVGEGRCLKELEAHELERPLSVWLSWVMAQHVSKVPVDMLDTDAR